MPDPTPQSERLGAELKALRTLAGLNQRAFGGEAKTRAPQAARIEQPRVHRIERGEAVPRLAEFEAWLEVTLPADARAEHRERLRPLLDAAHNPTATWRDLLGTDIHLQSRAAHREAGCSLIRNYSQFSIPGLLETAEYARQFFALVNPAGADVAAQVSGRIARQEILYGAGRRFEFIIGAPALRWSPGPGVMPAQLDRLASLATLAAVEVRILPDDRVGTPPWHDFVYRVPADETETPWVTGELLHGEFAATHPDAVAAYEQLWAQLWSVSIVGEQARNEIETQYRAETAKESRCDQTR